MFKIAEYNFILPYVINIIEGEALSKIVIPLSREQLDDAFKHIGLSGKVKTAFELFREVNIAKIEANINPPFFANPKNPEIKTPTRKHFLESGEAVVGANNLGLSIQIDVESFESAIDKNKRTFVSGLDTLVEGLLDDLLKIIRWKTGQYWIGQHLPTHVFFMGQNATYFDEVGKVFLAGISEGGDWEVGDTDRSEPLREKEWVDVKNCLLNGIFPEIYEDLFLDAQHLLFYADDVRRAVLEAAMSCEVFVKSYIIREGGTVYQYMVDKVRSIRVLDYLDEILTIMKGKSLREENIKLFKYIETLFQVRNNIVHRGECVYFNEKEQRRVEIDYGGAWVLIDKVKELIEWLK